VGQRGEATEGSGARVDIETLDSVPVVVEIFNQPVTIACQNQILPGRVLKGCKRHDGQTIESPSARPKILFGRIVVAVPPDRGKVDREDDS
jgi:hypothetical protein